MLDESLSRNIAAGVSAATGYSLATVWSEWPGRDVSINPLPDEEIIHHLGGKAACRAVWITADWNARRQHRRLLDAQQISVLWLLKPGNRNLAQTEQRQMLIAILETAYRIVAATIAPVYLRARFAPGDVSQPILERLAGTLLNVPRDWQQLPLE